MPQRVHNFNAGPSAIPLPVLERARDELLDYAGTGMSIMEHSHRGKAYEAVHNEGIALLRELLALPETHDVLFLQGGGHQQFAQVPMNFLRPGASADYVLTGSWGERAYEEAQNVGLVRVAGSTGENGSYARVPAASELEFDPRAAYLHYTTNETVHGVQFSAPPEAPAGVPLVADASSDFLSAPFDFARHGLVYAGAQKNLGPSGVVVVIVRRAWLAEARADLPVVLRYATYAENNSLYNTPPTFAIYMVRNVLSWAKDRGGVAALAAENAKKAETLYGVVDANAGFFRAPVERASRSLMNAVFRLPSEALEKRFVAEAEASGMFGLKGHRSVGGIRVSMYNAVSLASVDALCSFMREFVRVAG